MVEQVVAGQKVQRAQVNPALCLGCGACVAVCPENAINLQGWTLKQYEAMVDMIVSDAYLERGVIGSEEVLAPRRLLPPHPNPLPHWGRGDKVEPI